MSTTFVNIDYNVNGDDPVFFLLVLKQVNAVAVVMILIMCMQNCAFLMFLKI